MAVAESGRKNEWLVLRHLEHEHIGTIAAVLEAQGDPYRYIDIYRGDAVPQEPAACAGLIVMGGSMGVYEEGKYPFLAQEQALIRRTADAGRPVLGICLGAQLVAAAFGARVYPSGKKEIGWYPIEKSSAADPWTQALPERFPAFHWHGDTFNLPPGATCLFSSDLFQNQAFRMGTNILALQFHFEVNAKMIAEWLDDESCRKEIAATPGISEDNIRFETQKWALTLEVLSKAVFHEFFADVAGR